MNNAILLLEIFLVIFCLFASSFFSLAEAALMSMNKVKIKGMIEEYREKAIHLEKIVKGWDSILITLLICNNISNILATALFTVCSTKFLEIYDFNMEASAVIATTFLALVILVFGEIVPKTFAKRYSEPILLKIISPLNTLSKILFPLSQFFKIFSVGVMRLMGFSFQGSKNLLTEKEIVAIVNAGERDGVIEKEERNMITSVIEFGDTYVREVMIPRVDMVTIDAEKNLKEVLDLFQSKTTFSRIPLVMDSVDNIVGIIYAKDLMKYVTDPYFERIRVIDICRKPFFIPDGIKLDDALHMFKKERIHMGIVIDEYGGTAGLVTIEDLLEEIVGDIMDEYDGDQTLIRVINERVSIVDAKTNLYELNEKLKFSLPEDPGYDSLGGFLISIAEGIPAKGVLLTYENLEFQILEADEKRIYKVKIDIKSISDREVNNEEKWKE